MSAYDRGNLSPEGYLVRILAGIVRQSGGELRIKGESIDHIGEATFLIKEWDAAKQELVLRAGMYQFCEVFRVNPERHEAAHPRAQMVDPAAREERIESMFTPRSNIFENPRLAELERKKKVAQAAALIREELRQRREMQEVGGD